MKFWIQQPETMCIDNCVINGLSFLALPASVNMVFWDGATNKGELEYLDAMPIRTPFLDPSPYMSFVDQWLTKGKTETPPLILAQAKLVKQDVVETLYAYNRQIPVPVPSVGWTFDGSDDSVVAINRALSAASSRALGDFAFSINAALTQLRNNTDSALAAGTVSGSVSGDPPTFAGTLHFPAIAAPLTIPAPIVTVYLAPVGYAGTVAFTNEQACDILTTIENRRASLNATRINKRSDIQALTTIDQVIAYDVTSGW